MLEKLSLCAFQILIFDGHEDRCVIWDTVFNMPRYLEGVLPELAQGFYDFLVDADQQLIVAAFDDGCMKMAGILQMRVLLRQTGGFMKLSWRSRERK